MKLTRHTDYSLRALIYLGVHTDRRIAIAEISDAYAISRNHLVKVIQNLARLGLVKTIRGRSGGVILAKRPEEIVLGRVILGTEPGFRMVEDAEPESSVGDVAQSSGLAQILHGALDSFFDQLNKFTLADLLENVDFVRAVHPPRNGPPAA